MEAAALQIELGEFIWHQLFTGDQDAAKEFYYHVLDWEDFYWFDETGPYYYSMFLGDGIPVSGILSNEGSEMSPYWLAYVHTPDLESTMRHAEAISDIPPMGPDPAAIGGQTAMIIDLSGTYIYALQPDETGPAAKRPAEGSFGWNVLYTPHVADAIRFYGEVFQWDILDCASTGPGRRSWIFGKGGMAYGAISSLPLEPEMEVEGRGWEAFWIHYVTVEDIFDAVARVKLHGGRIVGGPVEDPFGVRIVHCTDPQGAPFGLREAKDL